MVAVVASDTTGLFNSSLSLIGRDGAYGQASLGQGKERVYVNSATGSLLIQGQDDGIANVGVDVAGLRTYNSLGAIDDANGDDQWHLGFLSRVNGSGGSASVTRITADGASQTFTRQSNTGGKVIYTSREGAGADDTLVYENNAWVYEEGSSLVRVHYDNNGRQMAALDRHGHGHRYEYEGGLLARIVSDVEDSDGMLSEEVATLEYDDNDSGNPRITAISYAAKDSEDTVHTLRRQYYGYDGQGRLSHVTVDLSPEDNDISDDAVFTTTYTYVDTHSQLIGSISQSDGSALTFVYYESGHEHAGKVKHITDGEGATTAYTYRTNGMGGLDTTVTVAGRETTFVTDGLKRLRSMTAVVDAQEVTTAYTYTNEGYVHTVSRGSEQLVTFGYDADGNQSSQVNAAGDTLTRRFNDNNQVLEETVLLSGTGSADKALSTFYVYDAEDNLRFTLSPEGRVTEYVYNSLNQLVHEYRYMRDAYTGALVSGSEPSLNDMTMWKSGLASLAAFDVSAVDYHYDFRGQLASQVAYRAVTAAGQGEATTAQTTYFQYDMMGRLLGETSPALRQKAYAYDGLNRVLAEYDTVLVTSTEADETPALAGRTALVTHDYQDSQSRVTSTQHNGLVTVNSFDAAGRLTATSSGEVGNDTKFGVQRFYYDAQGRQIARQHSNGAISYTLYDAAGRQAYTVDRAGVVTAYAYSDASQLVLTTTYANDTVVTGEWLDGDVYALTVDGDISALVAITDMIGAEGRDTADDRQVRYVYDNAGRQSLRIDGEGGVTEYRYDSAGRQTHVIAYDVALDVNSDTVPALVANEATRVQRTFYSDDGLVLATLDAEGYATEYVYDKRGQATQVIAYATQSAAYLETDIDIALQLTGAWSALRPASNDNAQLIQGADRVQYTAYNGLGQVVTTVSPEGQVTRFAYDDDGQLDTQHVYAAPLKHYRGEPITLTPDAEDRITRYTYNARGQLETQSELPQGLTTRYIYNAQGYLIGTIEDNGVADEQRATWYKKDLLDRQTGMIGGRVAAESADAIHADMESAALEAAISSALATANTGSKQVIDAKGRLVSSTDAEGLSTYYYYDDRDQLIATISGDGEVVRHHYTNFGELRLAVTYTTRLALNAMSTLRGGDTPAALQATLDTLGSEDDVQAEYAYTQRGNLQLSQRSKGANATSHGQHITHVYDNFGQLTYSHTRLSEGVMRTDQQVHDKRGLRVSTIHDLDATRGQAPTSNAEVHSTYDAFGRILSQEDALGNVTRYHYNDKHAAGSEVTVSYPSQNGLVSTITTYDVLGRTIEVQQGVTGGAGSTAAHSQTYQYDGAARTQWVDAGDGTGTLLTYNAFGELTDTQTGRLVGDTLTDISSHVHLAYDEEGNTLTRTEGYGSDAAVTTTYTYGVNNRLASESVSGIDGVTQYFYDNIGRVITSINPEAHETRFIYDAAGQLRYRVNNENVVTAFTYDINGNTTSETVYNKAIALNGFDHDDVIRPAAIASRLEAEGAEIAARQQYVYDNAGRLLLRIDAVGAVTQNTYDARGFVVEQTKFANAVSLSEDDSARIAKGEIAAADVVALLPAANPNKDIRTASVYDKNGRVVFSLQRLDDGQAQVKQSRYDAAGQLIETRAMASTMAYNDAYDITDIHTHYALRADGAPLSTRLNTDDRITRFFYDSAGRIRFVMDAEGAISETRYNLAGRVEQSIAYAKTLSDDSLRAYLPSKSMAWLIGEIAVSSADRVAETLYDAAGRVKTQIRQVIDSQGVTSRIEEHWTYNRAGQKTSYTNANGDVWHYTYDAAGRLAREYSPVLDDVQVPAGNGTATNYPEARQVTAITYDDLGNVKTRTVGVIRVGAGASPASLISANAASLTEENVAALDAANIAHQQITRFTYDALGRQTTVTEPTVGDSSAPEVTSTTQYNALGQGYVNQIKARYTVEGTAQTRIETINTYKVYDAAGRVAYDVDAQGYVTAYQYDAQGNQVALTRYEKALSMTMRNSFTEITIDSFTDGVIATLGGSRTVDTHYNTLGQVIRVEQPSVHFSEVSEAGSVSNYQARPETTYEYNRFGELVLEREKINRTDYAETRYFYDQLGNQIYRVDAENYLTQYAYNAFGQVSAKMEFAGRVADPALTGYVIDSDAFPSMEAWKTHDRVWTYEYDTLGRKIRDVQKNLRLHTVDNTGGDLNVDTTTFDTTRTTTTDYDHVGNVVRIDDAGRVSVNVYDALGRLHRSKAPPSAVVTDVEGLRTSVSQSTKALLTEYHYDIHGNTLVTAQGAIDTTTSLDTSSALLSESAEGVRVSTQTYNARNQVVSQRDAEGNDTTFSYDYRGNVLQEVKGYTRPGEHYNYTISYTRFGPSDGVNGKTLYLGAYITFDSDTGELKGVIPASLVGKSESVNINVVATDVLGEVVFDGIFRTDPKHSNTDTDVDFQFANWHYATIDERTDYAITKYHYDNLGQVTETTLLHRTPTGDDVQRKVKAEYNSYGEIEKQGDPQFNGASNAALQVYFEYDDAGRLLNTNQGDGARKDYAYDLRGQVVRVKHQSSGETVNRLDSLGRVYQQFGQAYQVKRAGDGLVYRDTPVVRQQYDRWGNITQVTNANGYTTTYTYNQHNQIATETRHAVAVYDEANQVKVKSPVFNNYYDSHGQLIARQDTRGHTRVNRYDARGQLIQAQDELGHSTHLGYNVFGEQVATMDALGYITTSKVDKLGRVLETGDIRRPDDTSPLDYQVLNTFIYNELGHKTSFTNALGHTYRYENDIRGNVLRTYSPDKVSMSYEYDRLGRQTTESYDRLRVGYSEDSQLDKNSQRFNYFGQQISKSDLSDNEYIYHYDGNNRLDNRVINFRVLGAVDQILSYTYYENGLLKSIADSSTGSHSEFVYDIGGQLVSETRTTVNSLKQTVVERTDTGYDAHGRVTQVMVTDINPDNPDEEKIRSVLSYTYDAMGNRRSINVANGYSGNIGVDRAPSVNPEFQGLSYPPATIGAEYDYNIGNIADIFIDEAIGELEFELLLRQGDKDNEEYVVVDSDLTSLGGHWLQLTQANGTLGLTTNSAQSGEHHYAIRAKQKDKPELFTLLPFFLPVKQDLKPRFIEPEGFEEITTLIPGQGYMLAINLNDYIEDPESEPLTFDIKLKDGSALPDWLIFDKSKIDIGTIVIKTKLGEVVPSDFLDDISFIIDASDGDRSNQFDLVVRTPGNTTENRPPELIEAGPVTRSYNIDDSISIWVEQYFIDPDGDPLSLVGVENIPDFLYWFGPEANSTNRNRIKKRPNEELVAGEYHLTAIVQDTFGLEEEIEIIVVVSAEQDNSAPRPIDPDPVIRSYNIDDSISIWVEQYFTDPDGDALSLVSVRNIPDFLYWFDSSANDTNKNRIKQRPNEDLVAGSYHLTAVVRDTSGLLAEKDIIIEIAVSGANSAPVPNDPRPVTRTFDIDDDISISAVQYFTDPDSDPLSLVDVQGLPAFLYWFGSNASDTNKNRIKKRPGEDLIAGTYELTAIVEDPSGASAQKDIKLVIEAPPKASTITIPNTREGEEFSFDLRSLFTRHVDDIQISPLADFNLNTEQSGQYILESTGGKLDYESQGTKSIRVSATNSYGTTHRDIEFEVYNENHRPIVQEADERRRDIYLSPSDKLNTQVIVKDFDIYAGVALPSEQITVTAEYVDKNGNLIADTTSLFAIDTESFDDGNGSQTRIIVRSHNALGSNLPIQLVLTINDNVNEDTIFVLGLNKSVSAVDTPPTPSVTKLPDAKEGQDYPPVNLLTLFSDAQGHDITFDSVGALPPGFKVVGGHLQLTGDVVPYTSNREYDITVSVKANNKIGTGSFKLHIEDTNTAPKAKPGKDRILTMQPGEAQRNFPLFDYFEDDANVSQLKYTITSDNAGNKGTISFVEPNRNRLRYRPTDTFPHTVTAYVTATDANGNGLTSEPVAFTFVFPGVHSSDISRKVSSVSIDWSPGTDQGTLLLSDYFDNIGNATFRTINQSIDGYTQVGSPLSVEYVKDENGVFAKAELSLPSAHGGAFFSGDFGFTIVGERNGVDVAVDFVVSNRGPMSIRTIGTLTHGETTDNRLSYQVRLNNVPSNHEIEYELSSKPPELGRFHISSSGLITNEAGSKKGGDTYPATVLVRNKTTGESASQNFYIKVLDTHDDITNQPRSTQTSAASLLTSPLSTTIGQLPQASDNAVIPNTTTIDDVNADSSALVAPTQSLVEPAPTALLSTSESAVNSATTNLNTTNRIAHFNFDTDISDSTGATTSRAEGGASINATGGIYDGALRLDGVDDHVVLGNRDGINSQGMYTSKTISLWFKMDGTDGGRQVIYEQGGGSRGLNVYLDNNTLYAGGWDDTIDGSDTNKWLGTFKSIEGLEANKWYHVAVVLDANDTPEALTQGAFRAYLNGNEFDTANSQGMQLYTHNDGIAIGGINSATKMHDGTTSGDAFFAGTVDEVMLWSRVLDDGEINQIVQEAIAIRGDSEGGTLTGTDGDDIFISGEGNHKLYGGKGEDTYIYRRGDGIDEIRDSNSTSLLKFEDIASDEIEFVVSGNSLLVQDTSTGQTLVRVHDWFNNAARRLITIAFTDITLTPEQVDERVVDGIHVKIEDARLSSYGVDQDHDLDGYSITEDGKGIAFTGNTWKRLALPEAYQVTDKTVLSFRVKSDGEGEIQGIGLDTDNSFYNGQKANFQLYGEQPNGSFKQDYRYTGAGEWQEMHIEVGKFASGSMNYLTLFNDDDAGVIGNIEFSDIRLYENDSFGSRGHDLLVSNADNNFLRGYLGDDTYVYRVGGGYDIVRDRYGNNTLRMEGIKASEVKIRRSYNNLIITVLDTQELVNVYNWYHSDAFKMSVVFDDVTLDAYDLEAFYRQDKPIDFNASPLSKFSTADLPGSYTVSDDGLTLGIQNDKWLKTAVAHTVMANTYLSFEFKTDALGEDHVIGLDPNNFFGSQKGALFHIAGSNMSRSADEGFKYADRYTGNGDWQTFTIRVGDYFTGHAHNLVLGNVGDETTNSHFRNIQLFDLKTDGTAESDLLIGTAGDDTLTGGDGNNTLIGRGGDDALIGGDGADTYVYNIGDGHDTITDAGGSVGNTLRFGEGITPEQVRMQVIDGDFVVSFDGLDGSLTLGSWANSSNMKIRRVEFADGQVWEYEEVGQRTEIIGSDDTDDYNLGWIGAGFSHRGNGGDDTLRGGKRDDTYYYALGDGNDVIIDRYGNDTLVFEGISKHDVTAHKDGQHFILTLRRTGETVTLKNWFDWVNNDEGRAYRHNLHFSDGEFTGDEFHKFLRTGRPIDLSLQTFDWYSRGNMPGNVSVSDDGKQLDLTGDIWRRTGVGYTVTEDTYLSFEFKVSELGKRHVIGLDSNALVSNGAGALFSLMGEAGDPSDDQYYIHDHVYTGNGDWQTFTIKVGDYFTGDGNYLVFGNLDESDAVNSHFRNIQLYDVQTDGTADNDFLIGTETNNVLNGVDGNDTLIGRQGNDTLKGGDGHDTYIYNLGDGKDTIIDSYQQANALQFGEGIHPDDISVRMRWGRDVVVSLDGEDIITIKDGFLKGRIVVDTFRFASGVMWDAQDIVDRVAFAGNDNGNGFYYDYSELDLTFEGGKGNDSFHVGRGRDTYIYNLGDGNDTINDKGAHGSNIIRFGEGIAPENLQVTMSGGYLTFSFNHAEGSIRTKYWRNDIKIGEIHFHDGTQWSIADFTQHLIQHGDDGDNKWGAGELRLSATHLAGKGNDKIIGGEYNDTFLYRLGDGNDEIIDSRGNNTLVMEDISKHDVYITRISTHLLITNRINGESVKLNNWYHSVNHRMRVVFADGAFTPTELTDFAAPLPAVDLSANSFSEYTGQHSDGMYTLTDNNQGIEIIGNTWQKTAFDYTITDNTYLTFEFKANKKGERHAIGFDTDNKLDGLPGKFFQVWGNENNALNTVAYVDEYTSVDEWQTYTIKVGDYITGNMNYLTFINDDDTNGGTGNTNHSQFRNIRIGELRPQSAALSYTGVSSITAKAGTYIRESVAFTEANEAQLTVNAAALPDWLQYDAETQTVYGFVPTDFTPDTVITLLAHDGVHAGMTQRIQVSVRDVTPVQERVVPLASQHLHYQDTLSVDIAHAFGITTDADYTVTVEQEDGTYLGIEALPWLSIQDGVLLGALSQDNITTGTKVRIVADVQGNKTQGEFTLVVDGPQALSVGTIELVSDQAIRVEASKYFKGLSSNAKFGVRISIDSALATAQASIANALVDNGTSAALPAPSTGISATNNVLQTTDLESVSLDNDEPDVIIPDELLTWLSFDPQTGLLSSTKEGATALAGYIERLKIDFFAQDGDINIDTTGELTVSNGATEETYYFTYDAANRVQMDAGILDNGVIKLGADSQYVQYDAIGRAQYVFSNEGKTLHKMTYNAQGSLAYSEQAYSLSEPDANLFQHNSLITGQAQGPIPFNYQWYKSVEHKYNLLQQVEETVNYFAADDSYEILGNPHPKTRKRRVEGELSLANSVRSIQKFEYTDDGKIDSINEFSVSAQEAGSRINGSQYDTITIADVDTLDNHASRTTYSYDPTGRVENMYFNQFKRPAESGEELPESFTQSFAYKYEGRESYLEKLVSASGNNHFAQAKTESFYDANGNRIAVEETPLDENGEEIAGAKVQARYFDYTADGKLVRRQYASQSNTHRGVHAPRPLAELIEEAKRVLTAEDLFNLPEAQATRYIDDYLIGNPLSFPLGTDESIKVGITSVLDNLLSDKTRETIADKIEFAPDEESVSHYLFNGSQYLGELKEDGKINVKSAHVQSVNPTKSASTLRHTVRQGETLRTLANQYYGNADLWYVIADANGLAQSSSEALTAGQSIEIPEQANTSNRFDTFTPYNVAEVIGDTNPTVPYLPPPPEAGCNALETILIVAVTVLVTVYTAGAGSFSNGWLALANSPGAAFAGSVAGNLAGQVTGVALGVQDGIDFGSALVSGATAFVTAGIGQHLGVGKTVADGGKVVNGITTAATKSSAVALTAGGKALTAAAGVVTTAAANKLIGRPSGFRWANVAAAGVTSFIGSKANLGGGEFFENLDPSGFTGELVGGIARSGINYAVKKGVFNEGSWNFVDVATDSFGNALGNSIVGAAITSSNNRQQQQAQLDAFGAALLKDANAKLNSNLNGGINDIQDKVAQTVATEGAANLSAVVATRQAQQDADYDASVLASINRDTARISSSLAHANTVYQSVSNLVNTAYENRQAAAISRSQLNAARAARYERGAIAADNAFAAIGTSGVDVNASFTAKTAGFAEFRQGQRDALRSRFGLSSDAEFGTLGDNLLGTLEGFGDSLYQGGQFLGVGLGSLNPVVQGISYFSGNGLVNPFTQEYHSFLGEATTVQRAAGRQQGEIFSYFVGGETAILAGSRGVKAIVASRVASQPVVVTAAQAENLKSLTRAEFDLLRSEGQSISNIGPALSVAQDLRTGKISKVFTNDPNGNIPLDLNDALAQRLANAPDDVLAFERTKGIASHSEVFAVNEILNARPGASFNDIAVFTQEVKKASLRGEFKPACVQCDFLLNGVQYVR
ncbi:calcium-binding protein [Agaribacter flavus]|uniref:Calcium-binding protein n=1 Tax=Agaribacter flavus TaxID=1902781 RepID=A0ABV7FJP1_9ALTE